MAKIIRAHRTLPALLPAEARDARAVATQLVREAKARAQALEADAVERGRELGRAELAAALLEVEVAKAQALAQLHEHAAHIGLEVASRLVHEALEQDPSRIAPIVAPLLAKVRRAHTTSVRVNPSDAEALRSALPTLRTAVDAAGAVNVIADSEITRGGCVVESNLGEVDARVETRIDALLHALGSSQP